MIPINSYGFIYLTTNKLNGKKYIGQKSIDWNGKWRSYLGGGKHLNYSIRKYGKENFKREIICYTTSPEDANEKERYYIEKFNAHNSSDFYNIVEGGDVSEYLGGSNCKPVINIDTNYIFKSIKDAAEFFNIQPNKVSETFNYKHSLKFKSDRLIFKPLNALMKNSKLCAICASNIDMNNNYVCCKCLKDENFKNEYVRINNFDSNNTYDIHSQWVNNYLERYSLNKERFRYKELRCNIKNDIGYKHIKKIKAKVGEYTPSKDLMNNIDTIKKHYIADKMSIHSIENEIGVNGVKDFLKYLNIKLRPTCYNNYNNSQIQPTYIKLIHNNEIMVFKYVFEFTYWIELNFNKKYKNAQIKNYIGKNKNICNLNYEEVTEKQFNELILHYKKVDEF